MPVVVLGRDSPNQVSKGHEGPWSLVPEIEISGSWVEGHESPHQVSKGLEGSWTRHGQVQYLAVPTSGGETGAATLRSKACEAGEPPQGERKEVMNAHTLYLSLPDLSIFP